MASFAEVFGTTEKFLRSKGIAAEINAGPTVTVKALKEFEQQAGLALPASFSEFYTGFANGLDFRWIQDEDTWGIFSLPPLEDIAFQRKKWVQNIHDFLDDPHSLDKCIKPRFRPQAFDIWRQMLSWTPVWNEESDDQFCLDTTTGQILCYQRDWFDGFGSIFKSSSFLAGENLLHFAQNWSRFCFQPDRSLWWGNLEEGGIIKWEARHFNPEFSQVA